MSVLIPVMEGKECYTPEAYDAFGSPYKHSPGATYDYVRRVIAYQGEIEGGGVNDTGAVLWSGQNKVAIGGVLFPSQQKNLNVAVRSIDTETVNWHDCHGPTRVVPTGVHVGLDGTIVGGSGYVDGAYLGVELTGGSGTDAFADIIVDGGVVVHISRVFTPGDPYSPADVLTTSNANLGGSGSGFTFTVTGSAGVSDGTWLRFVESSNEAKPQLVDPRTGNVWHHVNSFAGEQACTIYLFQRADDFEQVISPLLSVWPSAHMEPLGISNDWTYVSEKSSLGQSLLLTPRTIQDEEVGADSLLAYASFSFPEDFADTTQVTQAFTFADDQTVYFVRSLAKYNGVATARDYQLWRFDEPSSAPFGGPVVGGGFTEVTPWTDSTGPNTSSSAHNRWPGSVANSWENPTFDFLYPIGDQIGILSKFFSWNTSATLVADPALTFFDFTYFDIAGEAFDYHHAFVTGYMAEDWTTLPSGIGAAWIVIDAHRINSFVAHNAYTFSDFDYTKIWLSFTVQPYDAGFANVDRSLWHTIFVQYQLEYGLPPTVLQIIDEVIWDERYTEYSEYLENTNIVRQSQSIDGDGSYIGSSGIYDGVTNSFWWDGEASLTFLDPALSIASGGGSPFLKLSFNTVTTGQGQGHLYTRRTRRGVIAEIDNPLMASDDDALGWSDDDELIWKDER